MSQSKNKWFFRSIATIVCVVAQFCSGELLGQNQPVFIKMNKSRDLSSGSVTSITQGKDGFIWIGTKSGLSRYDGTNFKVFHQEKGGLSADDISAIFVDSKKRMWVATIGGLNLFDNNTEEFTNFVHQAGDSKSLNSNEVNTIYEDGAGNIWIGTEKGLNRFVEIDSTFESFYSKKDQIRAVSQNSVKSIFEDQEKNLWLGTFGGGLHKVNHAEKSFFPVEGKSGGIYPRYINAIDALNGKELLVGTSGEGLLTYDIELGLFKPFFDEREELQNISIVRAIYKSGDQNIWIGTDGDGLIQISRGNGAERAIQYVKNNNVQSSLSSNAIYSIFEDSEGNLWIGTAWNGINIIKKQETAVKRYYSDFRGENPAPVLSIFKDDENLWFGTDGFGLNILNLSTSKIRNLAKEDLGGDYIQFIKKRKKGGYFIGTFASGLLIFDHEVGVRQHFKYNLNRPNSLSYNDIRDVIEEENGNFWVATWGGGLCYYEQTSQQFTIFKRSENNPASLSSDNVTCLASDEDGNIWVGTFGGGLNFFDTESKRFMQVQALKAKQGAQDINNIVRIFKDSRDFLWIGTWDNGLLQLNLKDKSIKRFDKAYGLAENTITAIAEDDGGNIWVSTKNGVARYDYATDHFQLFSQLDGEYHINAVFKDGADLYFGNNEGVVSFNTEAIKKDPKEPEIKFTGLKLFNKEVKIGGADNILDKNILYEDFIELAHDHSVVTFEFSALQFPVGNYEYAIKLENFDEAWREIGHQQTATYTNLAPGNYVFKVKAKHPGGDWGEDHKEIEVLIHKPLWKMWWAYLIYIVVFSFLLYLFYRYTIQWEKLKSNLQFEKLTREKEKELNKLKLKFFTNVSHEIRTPVTLILGSINRIAEDIPVKKLNAINEIRKNSTHLLQLVNELLDFRKLESEGIKLKAAEGNFVRFVEEIFLSFSSHAANLNIHYEFIKEKENIPLWYDRDQMEKVVYNLLSNALKYTDAGGNVKVRITEKDEQVVLSVEDTGKGIQEAKLDKIFKRFYQSSNGLQVKKDGFGIGLSIARNIVKLHLGEILVESEINKGSIFQVKLLKGEAHIPANQKIELFKDSENVESYALDISDKTFDLEVAKDFRDVTLLIVEDNEAIKNYLRQFLQPLFPNILQASNGKEALELAHLQLPDLIISDVMMPEMDGISMTKKLKMDIRTSHIPIVLLTARTSLIYKKEGLETGADDYITKPFSEALLKARVVNLLRARKVLREKFRLENFSEPQNLPITSPDQRFLQDLIKILEENLGNDELKADFIAREIGISHSVVYKKIKSLTGLSLVEFIRDFRLKRAAQLLEKYSLSVTDVCYKVGFSDRRYFSQMFKKKYGKTPSEYGSKEVLG